MSDPISDEQLMLQYREGSLAAFLDLYRRYSEELYRYIAWRSPRAQWVDEVVVDTWATLHRAPNRYQPDASFRVFLYQAARLRLFDTLREYQHLLPSGGPEAGKRRDQFDVLADAMQEPVPPQHWRRALAALPAEQREAVVLQQFNNLDLIELAQVLGMPATHVRNRLRDAVFALRQYLTPPPPRKALKPGEVPVNDVDDAQLNAFLERRDALAQQLKTIEQPVPNAQSEAPIVKRVSFALEQDAYAPPADEAPAQPAPREPSQPWRLWPLALGLFALAFVGVLLKQRADVPPDAMSLGGSNASDAAPLTASGRQTEMVAHSRAPQGERNSADPAGQKGRTVTAQRVDGGERSASASASVAAADVTPDAWLGVINDLLKAGLTYQAVEEFGKFRAVNPDYPVPAAMQEQLKAASK